MRLTEKPIRFYTNIDGNIPNSLFGDEVRLRQILLNLLSNAAKYTDKGFISLAISVQKRVEGQVDLEITVSDSGKGIKPEDQEKLFGSFVQVDTKKNRGIEGTGLGLAITKKLCEAMGGDIGVQSEYGKGSAFSVHIPQGVCSTDSFAAVENAAGKKVLVYEHRTVYAKSVCWSLQNMGVPHTLAVTPEEFSAALLREEWYYVFSGYGLYEEIRKVMTGTTPPLALMVEWENEANIPNVRFISLPVQSLSIANVLNGKADTRDYFNTQNSGLIRFTYPSARLLIVDDISTNLKVAEGLLSPYHTKIDTSLNGARAIELVKKHKYDIVFMDHMMPEMDGIEATAAIRAWEEETMSNEQLAMSNEKRCSVVPIIALTANAVSGMREMFIEKGFNDFLAKPIDISKLDETLHKWIPKEKREKEKKEIRNEKISISNEQLAISNESNPDSSSHCSLLTAHCSFVDIPGVDIEKGISMTGGTMKLYRQVIGLFRKDAEERLSVLNNVLQHNTPDAGALNAFVTQVHALKSASASVGAAEISAKAAELESAGKAGNVGFIRENLPSFTKDLAELAEGIRVWENAVKEEAPKGKVASIGDNSAVMRLLKELSSALETENAGDIDRILEELNKQNLDAKMKEALDAISDNVLMTEYQSAAEIIRSLLNL
jgi:CheY-like chemotaxis protein